MNRERFARGVLAVCALSFAALGLYFLAWPEELSVVGLSADTAAARAELRATYGGLELGLGVFLGWCALGDAGRLRAGLLATAFTIGGFGAGRLLGLLVDRPPESVFLVLLGVEVGTVALVGVALKLLAQAPPRAAP